MDRLELGASVSVISLAIVNTLSMYKDVAPKLSELRHSTPGDFGTRQALLDADIFGGIAVLLIGGGAAALSRRWTPLVLASSGLLLISLYYRMVAASATPADVLTQGRQ